MKKLLIILMLYTLPLQGCGIIIHQMYEKSMSNKTQKRKFLEDFHSTNLERERAGLEPLDLCIEMYRFDKGWACSLEECHDFCRNK